MLKRIDHINVVVTDIKGAEEFFLTLGFTRTEGSELSGPWISKVVGLPEVKATYAAFALPGSNTTIELIEYHNPPSPKREERLQPNEIGFRHVAFAVDNIESEVERLRKAGVEFMSEIQVFPANGKKLVYLYGPERIVLELAEYRQ